MALFCGALLALSGCGGGSKGSKIPADQSSKIIAAVQAADQYSTAGRCSRAHTKVRDARYLLGQVPKSVSAKVRQNIADSLSNLDSLINGECKPPQQTQTNTTPTQTQTTTSETTTTPSTTTPTTTTPSTTTPTTTTPSTTTPTTTTPTTTGTTTTGNGGTPPTGTGAGGTGTG